MKYLLSAEHYVSCVLSQSSAATDLYYGFVLKIRRFLNVVWDVFWFGWFTYELKKKNSLLQTAGSIDERRCFSLCLHVFMISVLLFKELEFLDMMILVFSNRHRWHFFDTLVYAGARPIIAHFISFSLTSVAIYTLTMLYSFPYAYI